MRIKPVLKINRKIRTEERFFEVIKSVPNLVKNIYTSNSEIKVVFMTLGGVVTYSYKYLDVIGFEKFLNKLKDLDKVILKGHSIANGMNDPSDRQVNAFWEEIRKKDEI